MTSTITVTVEDLEQQGIQGGLVVSARLVPPSGQRALPRNHSTNALISTSPQRRSLTGGAATLTLVRASALDPGWTYTVEVLGSHDGSPVQASFTGLQVGDSDTAFWELLQRVGAGEAPHYELIDQATLNAAIQAALRDVGTDPRDDSVTEGKLSPTMRDWIRQAVDITGFSNPTESNRRIGVTSNSGTTESITLPGETFTTAEQAKLAGLAQADWDATSGGAEILNKPTIADTADLESRVEHLEAVEEAAFVNQIIVDRMRVVVSSLNTSIALGGARVPRDSTGRMIDILVTAVGEPSAQQAFDLTTLLALGKVTGDNQPIGTSNALRLVNAPDNNQYYVGVDTQGDLFFGSDTADTYYVTIVDRLPGTSDEHVEDVAAGMLTRGDASGDVDAVYDDNANTLTLDVKDGVIDPAKVRFDAGTQVGGRAVQINAAGDGFVGIEGGAASELSPVATVPTDVSGANGLIANVLGTLYALVPSGEARNVTSGAAAAQSDPAGYFGDDYIIWRPGGGVSNPVIAWATSSTLESIWVRFHVHGAHGFVGQFDLTTRLSARDKLIGGVQYYAYGGGTDAVEEGVVAGTEFTATFTAGSADGAAVNVHGQVKRWELYLRDLGSQINGYVTRLVKSWALTGGGNPPASVLGARPGPTATELYNGLQARLVAGDNITFTPDAGAQTISIAGEAGGGGAPGVGQAVANVRGPAWYISGDLTTSPFSAGAGTVAWTTSAGFISNAGVRFTRTADGTAAGAPTPNGSVLGTDLPAVPQDGQIGYIVASQVRIGTGDWETFAESTFGLSGEPYSTALTTNTGFAQALKVLEIQNRASSSSTRAAVVQIVHRVFAGNGNPGLFFRPVPNAHLPTPRVQGGRSPSVEIRAEGVASGGVAARWRIVIYPMIISGTKGDKGDPGENAGVGPHITTLIDGPGAGLASGGGQHATGPFTLFDPDGAATTFDLDDNPHGVVNFEASVTLSVSGTGASRVGFDTNTSDPLRTASIERFAFAQRILALPEWDSTQPATTGIEVGAIVVRDGSTTLGTYRIYLAHNGNNELGYVEDYRRASGSNGLNFANNLEASFIPNDAPAAPATRTPFRKRVSLGSDMAVTLPSTANQWGDWTTLASYTLLAGEGGLDLVRGAINAEVDGTEGQRVEIATRLIFERGSGPDTSVLIRTQAYARNWAGGIGGDIETMLADEHELQDGDVVRVQARGRQQTAATRTVTFKPPVTTGALADRNPGCFIQVAPLA